MKKASFPAILSTAIVCFLFWLLITGQVVAIFRGDPSWQVLIAGLIVSLCTAAFSAPYFIHSEAFYLWNPVRLGRLLVYCLFVFPWELIKANVDVARRALDPRLQVRPGIVKVPVELESEYARTMLANSITLTPGTITMDMAEDGEGKLWYYIHWIDAVTDDPAQAGQSIKGTLEKWVRRIWE